MTRKDYVAIAAALRATRPTADFPEMSHRLAQWTRVRAALANVFLEDNENFDVTRFYAACDANLD